MGKTRLRFCKTGRQKYISHLDLMATLRRALLRAGVSLKYSQGFNPHPVMSIALPLSVGSESVCELMDFESLDGVLPDDLPAALNDCLPEGIMILENYTPERKFAGIAWIEVDGRLVYDGGTPDRAAERLSELYAAESVMISKKTKKGISDIDLVPFVRDIEFAAGEDGALNLRVKLSAQNPSVSPDNFISAIALHAPELTPDFASFKRVEVFDADMNVFR